MARETRGFVARLRGIRAQRVDGKAEALPTVAPALHDLFERALMLGRAAAELR